MATYVAFLRAINLGPHRKLPKADLARVVAEAGFEDVETYLNTGNARFSTSMRSRTRIEQALERAFAADRGFEVPTIVFSPADLRVVAEAAGALDHDGHHYVALLRDDPVPEGVEQVRAVATAEERVEPGGRAVHLLVGADGVHGTKLTNALVERHLGTATTRNRNVITTLAQRWGS